MKAIFFEESDEKVSEVLHMPRNLMALMRYALSCLLLSAISARAEAPPSQEFWNYFVEFGDTQGELFDPSDYAAVANLAPDAQRKNASNVSAKSGPTNNSTQVPTTDEAVREQRQ